ncbi:MAG TPA: SOS response-associated peptidase [Nitrospiraceae bacterium]
MCGRFTLATPAEIVAEFFELTEAPALPPRYNIAPTQPVVAIVIARASARRELRNLRWGLVPSWAKDPKAGGSMINARAETLTEKPAFREVFRRQRCLVIADGFYEWMKLERRKQPYYIRMANDNPFAFAGLWDHWEGADAAPIDSCTVVTGEPNELVRDLHDRMPAILDRSHYDRWLDPRNEDVEELQAMLRPYPAAKMKAFPVSSLVNSPANNEPGCIARMGLFD